MLETDETCKQQCHRPIVIISDILCNTCLGHEGVRVGDLDRLELVLDALAGGEHLAEPSQDRVVQQISVQLQEINFQGLHI